MRRNLAAVALLLAASCHRAAGGREPPPLPAPIVETRIDLLQRLPAARVTGAHPPRRGFAVLHDDIRESLVACPPTTVRFEDLPVHSGARLRFAFAAGRIVSAAAEPVVFVVRVVAGGRTTEVFRRAVEPKSGEFDPWREADVPLEEAAAGNSRVALELETLGGDPLVRAAWAWPEIVSAGTLAPGDRRRLTAEERLRDLLADLDAAELSPGPAGSVRRLDPGGIPDPRLPAAALVPPGAFARWRQPLLPGLQLVFRFHVARSADAPPAAGRVGFVLRARSVREARNPAPWHTLAERSIDLATLAPGAQGLQTVFDQVDLDLAGDPGSEIEIELAGRGSNPPPGVRAALGALFLVRRIDRPRARRDGSGRNIVVLLVDTLRADRLGTYGESRPTSPDLDALAAGGIVFDDARAPAPLTGPSTAALFTGRPLSRDIPCGQQQRLPFERVTIAEAAQRNGWTTAAFVANALLAPGIGFEQGFEEYFDVAFRPAEDVSRRAAEWIREHREERFLLYVHYLDPHAPYSAPDPWYDRFSPDYAGGVVRNTWTSWQHPWAQVLTQAMLQGLPVDPSPTFGENARRARTRAEIGTALLERLETLYAGEIRYWNDQLRLVLDALDDAVLRDRTIIAVTADHGEEFAEDRHLGHGFSLHDAAVRVPLLLAGPLPGAPRRIPQPVSLADLAPLLLDLAGIPVPDEMAGRTLAEIESGAPAVVCSATLSYVRPEPDADPRLQTGVRARTADLDVLHLVRDDAWFAPAAGDAGTSWHPLRAEEIPVGLREAVAAFERELPQPADDARSAGSDAAAETGRGLDLDAAAGRRLEALRALGYIE